MPWWSCSKYISPVIWLLFQILDNLNFNFWIPNFLIINSIIWTNWTIIIGKIEFCDLIHKLHLHHYAFISLFETKYLKTYYLTSSDDWYHFNFLNLHNCHLYYYARMQSCAGQPWFPRRSARLLLPQSGQLQFWTRVSSHNPPGVCLAVDPCTRAGAANQRKHLESDTHWITLLVGVYTRYIQMSSSYTARGCRVHQHPAL